ncbi:hypothetical protein KAI87_14650 [Myxococcota bacterium]|nr:hypothetical protein [Myxococcota bacterium]
MNTFAHRPKASPKCFFGKSFLLVFALGLTIAASGCGGESESSFDDGDYACVSHSLSVMPEQLVAGADTNITIEWALGFVAPVPVQARLVMGDGEELTLLVELSLEGEGYDYFLYHAQLQNPFGRGIDAGYITVIAEAPEGFECPSLSASASLRLLAAE